MSLRDVREQRKKLGPRPKSGPKTVTLVLLLVVVLVLMWVLGSLG